MNWRVTISPLIFTCIAIATGAVSADARRAIPDDNLAYPVLIQTEGGFGSGFYMNDGRSIILVTARHVLLDKNGNLFKKGVSCLSYSKDPKETNRNEFILDLEALMKSGDFKDSEKYDVAALRIGNITGPGQWDELSGVVRKTKALAGIVVVPTTSIKRFDDIMVSNEVYVLGFPKSLGLLPLKQYDYDKPLLRKGIIAGKNEVNQSIMLDVPVNPGNSGGPVVEVEEMDNGNIQYKIVGLAIQLVPMAEEVSKYGLNTAQLSNSMLSVAMSMNPVLELISTFYKSKDGMN